MEKGRLLFATLNDTQRKASIYIKSVNKHTLLTLVFSNPKEFLTRTVNENFINMKSINSNVPLQSTKVKLF